MLKSEGSKYKTFVKFTENHKNKKKGTKNKMITKMFFQNGSSFYIILYVSSSIKLDIMKKERKNTGSI